MLVLSRRSKEQLVLGGAELRLGVADAVIRIHVLRLSKGQVQLGIEAPPGVVVVRGELLACDQGDDSPTG